LSGVVLRCRGPRAHRRVGRPAHRLFAFVLALFVAAMGTIVFPSAPAAASPAAPDCRPRQAGRLCSLEEWQATSRRAWTG
jgi:hypothetical protein